MKRIVAIVGLLGIAGGCTTTPASPYGAATYAPAYAPGLHARPGLLPGASIPAAGVHVRTRRRPRDGLSRGNAVRHARCLSAVVHPLLQLAHSPEALARGTFCFICFPLLAHRTSGRGRSPSAVHRRLIRIMRFPAWSAAFWNS
jgi:hypothetical protein